MRLLALLAAAAMAPLAACGHCHDEALAQENEALRAELAKYTRPSDGAGKPAPAFAALPKEVAIGQVVSRPWYRLAVLGTKVCSRRRVGDETKQLLLGVEVVVDNLSDTKLDVEGNIEENDMPLGQVRRYVSRDEECEPLLRTVAPGRRERGMLVVELPREPQKPKLVVPMREPHGFAEDRVVVDLAAAGTQARLPPPPSGVDRPGKGGPVRETPFYRVSVVSVRRCTRGLDKEGNETIGVELLVESFIGKPLEVRGYDAKLRDREGYVYETTSSWERESVCKPEMPRRELEPNGKVRGFFARFSVKPGARGLVLTYPIRAEDGYNSEDVLLALPDAR